MNYPIDHKYVIPYVLFLPGSNIRVRHVAVNDGIFIIVDKPHQNASEETNTKNSPFIFQIRPHLPQLNSIHCFLDLLCLKKAINQIRDCLVNSINRAYSKYNHFLPQHYINLNSG